MKTAAARGGRGSERSAHKVAEKLAKRAGVDFEDWISDAVAEYAEDLGVDPRDLSERERLEAIEDRIDRAARAEVEPAPRREIESPAEREAPRPRRFARERDEDDEGDSRRDERNRLDEAIARIESRAGRGSGRAEEARAQGRSRLEATIEEIETRAERNEARTARALESLTGLVEARGQERHRLDHAVAEIEKRAERNEKRTAQALELLQSLVVGRGGESDRLNEAIAKVEARAERNAERTAKALEALTGLVDARASERDRLEAAVERAGKRAEETEARTAKALESLTTLVQTPPPARDDAVAARLDALSRRAARAPAPGDEDDETFRLVSERLARRRKARDDAQAPAPEPRRQAQAPEPARAEPLAADDMKQELRRLADKVDHLSSAAAAQQAQRAQAQETASAGAAEKAATVERMERQVVQLAQLVERLVGASPAPAELAEAVKALADVRGQIDRLAPGPAIQALDRRVEDLSRRIEAAARRPATDLKPLDDLSRRVETLRLSLERQAASRPDAGVLYNALQSLNDKIDRAAGAGAQSTTLLTQLQDTAARLEDAMRRPAVDPAPFDDLARRVEAVRVTLERQGASRPDAQALFGALQALGERIDRAANAGTQSAALLTSLQAMVARVEEALRHQPPVDDLARRIESVRGAVERQSGLSPRVEALHAAVGELHAKFERPAVPAAEIERLEGALRQLGRQVETALSRSVAVDLKPVEELARRIESLRKTVETQGAPSGQVERLERQLAEIVSRLDRPMELPQIEAVGATLRKLATRVDEVVARPVYDSRPLEDLARRIDSAGSGFAPHAARVEAALGQLSAKVDEAASRSTTVSLDPRPIEDLARRIESVRESLENPPALGSHVERLESVLGKVAAKLDEAGPVIDANGINSTLAAMNARLEEAFRRPATTALDREPLDALSARVDAVRETIARQSEQIDGVGRPLDELTRRLESLSQTLERQTRNFSPESLVEAVRDAVQTLPRPALGLEANAALTAAIERLAARLDRGLSGFDSAEIEDLLRQALARLDRPSVTPADLDALTDAVADLAGKVETPADPQRIAALLERIDARLERPAEPSADLSALIDIVSGLAGGGAPAPDLARIESRLAEIAARLEQPGADPRDFGAVAEAMEALSHKLDRSGAATSFALLEDLTRDIVFRLDGLETKLDDRAPGPVAPANMAALEASLREIGGKLGEIRAVADNRGVEQELRQLQERIDEVADTRMSNAFVEQAAQALARDVGERIAAATPDVLIELIRDIHDRIDVLGSARPAPALEGALAELTDELESLRSARGLVDRGVATLTDLRQEQSQFDRRMDARFTGVQDILEKLVDRLGRLEREIAADGARPAAPVPAAPPRAPNRAQMLEIPDRSPGEIRAPAPLAQAEPLTAEIAAQGRGRDVNDVAGGKAAALNGHIAAARRAASAAAADMERREEAARETKGQGGVAQRATALFSQHRRPVLLGAAGLMTVLTGAAVLEMRGSHAPVRKSELEAPSYPSTPLALAPSPQKSLLDSAPTGAIATEPKVITSTLAPPKPEAGAKPAAALVSTLPQGLATALAAAGANGDVGAEVEIAQRFLEGRTVPRDPKVSAQWLQAAADAGSPFAQYRLAALYEKGVGVARDLEKARTLYKAAADAGNARAMHNLAVLYAQDGGAGKPDYATAMGWFRKAADYGVRDSQFNLGVLSGRGLGSAQDLAQSWMWFSLAAKQGDADAARKRDEVANRMDGRVMAAAKKALDDFHAKTPDPAVNDPPAVPAAAAEAPAGDAPKAATSVKG